MDSRVQRFFAGLKGKNVTFCGIGGSNLPLIRMFAQYGANVSARDKRTREKLSNAQALEALGVTLILGEAYLEDLTEEIIFRTPGMPFHLPQLEEARKRGAAVTSEMELFLELCPCRVFGITGSDGKTTTTTIVAKMLREAGKTVHLGGNIGTPLLPEIEKIQPDDVAVVELSSFQLISVRTSPDVCIITNVTPNHLDIHKDMKEYMDAKENILLHQNAFGRAVLNLDNEITAGYAKHVRGHLMQFSRWTRPDYGAYVDAGGQIQMALGQTDVPILHQDEIKIPGAHNVENYMAAFSALWGYVDTEVMCHVAKTFTGVEHRAELVREKDGVRWYNDSIATTPSRTIRGMLSLFPQKILLIAGGYDKKVPFEPMGEPVVEKVKTLVLMGATADAIETAVRKAPGFKEGCPKIIRVSSLEEAVQTCAKEAQCGDIAALSPACASFDMFPNYETRGDMFRDFVNAL